MTTFRDEFIAASLKYLADHLFPIRHIPFRDEFIAASLKCERLGEITEDGQAFRDEFIAASLKLEAEIRAELQGKLSAMNSSRPH